MYFVMSLHIFRSFVNENIKAFYVLNVSGKKNTYCESLRTHSEF